MFDSVRWHGIPRQERRPAAHHAGLTALIAARLAMAPSSPITADSLASDAYTIFRAELPRLWATEFSWRFLAHRDRPAFRGTSTASLAAYYHNGWNLAVSYTLVIRADGEDFHLTRLTLDEDLMAEDRVKLEAQLEQARETALTIAGDMVMLMWEQLRTLRELADSDVGPSAGA